MVNQGHPMGRQLLMQLPEDHGTMVPLLGLAEDVVQPGLEVSDIPDALSTVNFGKVALGFTEVLNGSFQSWRWGWGRESNINIAVFKTCYLDSADIRYSYILHSLKYEEEKKPTTL